MTNFPTIVTPASAQAENARHAETEPLNGNGFYRFKIGDFQATVISDGYGPIPAPIFAVTPLKLNSLWCCRQTSCSR
jgi:hypothetical protein